jgi:hypothetical protein
LISRVFISLRFAKSALVAVAILWTAAGDLGARDGSKEWIVLNNCRLIANPANDGDSFHVSAGEREYIFRLYNASSALAFALPSCDCAPALDAGAVRC